MNPKIFADLRNILAKLYPDEVSIRRIVADADFDIQRITFNSNAGNNWHSVLTEAEKVHHIEALLAVVEGEYGKNQDFKSVYIAYRQSTDRNADKKTGSVDIHPQAPVMSQRQRLPAVVVGLLLVGIVGGGLYWGIPGQRNLGIVISTAVTTVPDAEGTEAQPANESSMASVTPSPLNNTAVVTQTQVSARPFTSTPEPPTSTSTATVTPTVSSTPTPTPSVTMTPTPQPTAYNDEFNGPSLNPNWYWLWEDPSRWSLKTISGNLQIIATGGDFSGKCDNVQNILLQPAPSGDFALETRVFIRPTQNYQQGGLLIWDDADNWIELGAMGRVESIHLFSEQNGNRVPDWPMVLKELTNDGVFLKMSKNGNLYEGLYSSDGKTWIQIGSRSMPAMKNTQIGIVAYGGATSGNNAPNCPYNVSEIPVNFDFFHVISLSSLICKEVKEIAN